MTTVCGPRTKHSDPKSAIRVLVDTREQAALNITAYPVERATLPVGDYGIRGFSDWDNPAFIVERKTLGDLVACLTGERLRGRGFDEYRGTGGIRQWVGISLLGNDLQERSDG